jgi:hypothetical protein
VITDFQGKNIEKEDKARTPLHSSLYEELLLVDQDLLKMTEFLPVRKSDQLFFFHEAIFPARGNQSGLGRVAQSHG